MRPFLAECLEQCAHEPLPLREMADRLGATLEDVRGALDALRARGLAAYTPPSDVARATPRGRAWVQDDLHRSNAPPVQITPSPASREMISKLISKRLGQLGWTVTHDGARWVGVHKGLRGCIESRTLSGLLTRANERA